ncbi:helix-turn-helix domain-containing protein [Acidobacteriota bacterium]
MKKFPGLIKKSRKEQKLTISELAKQCNVSLALLSKVESGKVRLSPNKIVDIAENLGLDPTYALLVWLQDSLSGRKAKYVPDFKYSDYEQDFFDLIWKFHASLSNFHVQKVTREVEVDIEGNALLKRRIEGLAPRRDTLPVSQYVLRESVPEIVVSEFSGSPKLDFLEVPEGLVFEYTTVKKEKFIHHILSFPKGWKWKRGDRNAFSLMTRSSLKNAYFMDMETALKEYAEIGLKRIPMNNFTYRVNKSYEELELIVKLPEGYCPFRVEGFAWLGNRHFGELENMIDKDVCLSKEVTQSKNVIKMLVKRPLLNISLALAWEPIVRSKYVKLLKE